jgi:hypothetical protein
MILTFKPIETVSAKLEIVLSFKRLKSSAPKARSPVRLGFSI